MGDRMSRSEILLQATPLLANTNYPGVAMFTYTPVQWPKEIRLVDKSEVS
jgi:hypothetical protein